MVICQVSKVRMATWEQQCDAALKSQTLTCAACFFRFIYLHVYVRISEAWLTLCVAWGPPRPKSCWTLKSTPGQTAHARTCQKFLIFSCHPSIHPVIQREPFGIVLYPPSKSDNKIVSNIFTPAVNFCTVKKYRNSLYTTTTRNVVTDGVYVFHTRNSEYPSASISLAGCYAPNSPWGGPLGFTKNVQFLLFYALYLCTYYRGFESSCIR